MTQPLYPAKGGPVAIDPAASTSDADAVMMRACGELDALLADLCAGLDPFPAFMGHPSLRAVEVEEAPAILDAVGAAYLNVGCVVVCSDGALYELVMRLTPDETDEAGLDSTGELKALDLPPAARTPIAYAAVRALARLARARA